jgi:hypothetical protein
MAEYRWLNWLNLCDYVELVPKAKGKQTRDISTRVAKLCGWFHRKTVQNDDYNEASGSFWECPALGGRRWRLGSDQVKFAPI